MCTCQQIHAPHYPDVVFGFCARSANKTRTHSSKHGSIVGTLCFSPLFQMVLRSQKIYIKVTEKTKMYKCDGSRSIVFIATKSSIISRIVSVAVLVGHVYIFL